MALTFETETQYGGTAKYWKIIQSNYKYQTGKYNIKVALYINKKARNDLKNPIDYYDFEVASEFNTKAEMYIYLKSLPFFATATDDID